MKQYDFTVVGGGTIVQMLRFHELPVVGKTATPINLNPNEPHFGGCGFNVYSGLAKLGASVFPVLTHSNPIMGKRLHEDCIKYGVPETGIFGPEQERYYQCLMMGDDNGDHITIAYWYGADVDSVNFQHNSSVVLKDEFFSQSKIALLVVGNPDLSGQTVELARKNDVPLAYSYRNDPALVPHDTLHQILNESQILFTNEVEARSIENQFGLDHITDLFRIAKAKIIVTTLGKNGCIVYDKNHGRKYEQIHVPITCIKAGCADSVGAGDAFVAGFMYGISKGKTLETCAQYGSTTSSFVIEKSGSTTNLPTAEEMLERNATRPDAV